MAYLITADPQEIGAEVEKAAEKVIRFVVQRAWQNLTIDPAEGGTPRKTGFASASWIVSIGSPSTDVAGSPMSVDRGAGARGIEQLRSYTLSQGSVFLVNNVDYMTDLNSGSSKQAKPGFIDSCYQRAVNDAEKQFAGDL